MEHLYKPRAERWPQFSLRGLLTVVTLAALFMPWAIQQYRAWRPLTLDAEPMSINNRRTEDGP